MRPISIIALLAALMLALAYSGLATAAEPAPADDYGDFYSYEEEAALDTALWAGNMNRADLHFKKDYAKGFACYPVVREMMADPLSIGPTMSTYAHYLDSSPKSLLRTALSFDHLLRGEAGNFEAPDDAPPLSQFVPGFVAQPQPSAERLAAQIDSPQKLQDVLREMLATQLMAKLGSNPAIDNWDELREVLPEKMAWHKGMQSPYSDFAAWQKLLNDPSFGQATLDAWHAKSDASTLPLFSTLSTTSLYIHPENKYGWLLFEDPRGWLSKLPASAWPTSPMEISTLNGKVTIGTLGDDHYSGVHEVLVDPGGNDTYSECRLGSAIGIHDQSIGYFVDLGGDDFYDCGETDFTLGSAIFGFAGFYDLGAGDDRYYGGNFSLGAAAGGIATFYDDGGSDYYSGKVYTQGAAGFGVAIMLDDSVQPAPVIPTDVETPDPIDLHGFDNDTYTAWSESQAFARTRGIAICANRRGNETYHAGGVYLDAPLFTDRYQSFSQGFAIGERDIDYAGGIALLADYGGNDRYLGDVYNQGVGYWYSAGFLYDGGGNDLYEMTQYGQGSGIHLAVGGLIDEAGSDTYIMHNGLGQSGSHDFAASLLLDKTGNDRYFGNTSCNGCGLTNSAAIFIDREGDDVYAGKRGSLNVGRPARGFGSIGVLLDMAGTDDYLGLMHDDLVWDKDETGLGVDIGDSVKSRIVAVAEAKEPGSGLWLEDNTAGMDPLLAEQAGVAKNNAGFDKPSETLKMPDEISYSGALDQAIFDKLWEIAIRWEVGDNRVIVPEARKRLIAFGPEVLPYIEAKMYDPNSLAIRGYVDCFKAFAYEAVPPPAADAPAPDPSAPVVPPVELPTIKLVQELLARQLAATDVQRQQSALSVITELKLPGMGQAILPLLDNPDASMQRRAIVTIGAISDPAANERLLANLNPAQQPDEALIKASLEALCGMKVECYGKLRELLGYPSITVREALANQLKAQWPTYKAMVVSDYHHPAGLNEQAQRVLLRVLLAAPEKPTAEMVDDLYQYIGSSDWGVRQDFLALARKWNEMAYDDPELEPLFGGMTGLQRDISGMLETLNAPVPEHLEAPK